MSESRLASWMIKETLEVHVKLAVLIGGMCNLVSAGKAWALKPLFAVGGTYKPHILNHEVMGTGSLTYDKDTLPVE